LSLSNVSRVDLTSGNWLAATVFQRAFKARTLGEAFDNTTASSSTSLIRAGTAVRKCTDHIAGNYSSFSCLQRTTSSEKMARRTKWHDPSASGAEDDSPRFHRGPQPAPLLRGLGWLNGGWREEGIRVPRGRHRIISWPVVVPCPRHSVR
jgi:hypothetical protein